MRINQSCGWAAATPRESYVLENLTHNSPCPPRCKLRASPDARYHSSADWHILQHRESASHTAPRKKSKLRLLFARESASRQPEVGRNLLCHNVDCVECIDISVFTPTPRCRQIRAGALQSGSWITLRAHVLPQLVCPGTQRHSQSGLSTCRHRLCPH